MDKIVTDSSAAGASRAYKALHSLSKELSAPLIIYIALVILLSSCALIHGSTEGSSTLPGDLDGIDMDEYQALEHLEEHPLDPMTAEPDELRTLPGFPERLLKRLIDERERNNTIRRLFDSLTPPERDALRRYEPYLELPGRLPIRIEAWFTADRLGPGRERRDDMRLASRGEGFRARARYRSEDLYRFYLAGFLPSGHARLHVGDFTPDLAMGLCFSSYTATYPFSHGYHIRKRRWVSGTTSLYGASMRGGAAEFWAGSIRALFLGGRLCSYREGRLDVGGPAVLCGRFSLARGGFSVGAGIHYIERGGDEPVSSFDASWSEGPMETAAEISTNGKDWCGLWAISVRGKGSGMSLLVYELPGGMGHPLGRYFYGAGRWRRGGSIVLQRRLASPLRLFCSFERSDARDPFGAKRRDLLRLECRWSAGGSSVKLSLKRCIERQSILMPHPSSGERPEGEISDSIHLLQAWRLFGSTRLRVSCRAPLERGGRGYLVCPSLTIDRGLSVTLSWALHRAVDGMPLFYCYERSLKGQYPWRALRGDGWRVALIGGVSIGPVRIASGLSTTSGGAYEGGAQLGAKF